MTYCSKDLIKDLKISLEKDKEKKDNPKIKIFLDKLNVNFNTNLTQIF